MKKYRLPKTKIGDILAIRFLDHCEDSHSDGDEGPIAFWVYGKLSHKTKTSLSVDCWCYAEGSGRDHNVKSYTIVKSAIVELRKLGYLV